MYVCVGVACVWVLSIYLNLYPLIITIYIYVAPAPPSVLPQDLSILLQPLPGVTFCNNTDELPDDPTPADFLKSGICVSHLSLQSQSNFDLKYQRSHKASFIFKFYYYTGWNPDHSSDISPSDNLKWVTVREMNIGDWAAVRDHNKYWFGVIEQFQVYIFSFAGFSVEFCIIVL